MKILRNLFAAASLAALAAVPATAQHGHGGGGGGFHGGGGYHGGGSYHGGGGYHGGYGGGWHGGYGGGYYRGGYGWYGADVFALGLLGGYALSAPWGYSAYPNTYYDYAPPPPPSYRYDRAPVEDGYDGSDMQPDANGKHCPLYWNDKTNRYEPHCG